jgi:bacillithiol system protein YtxJ
MGNHFKQIHSSVELDELMELSKRKPVVLFKHSTTCPVSSGAYREMEEIPEVALIEVQKARDLSREIGARTGIEHESPQVIIFRNGQAVWHASHWKVTTHAVEQAIRENA